MEWGVRWLFAPMERESKTLLSFPLIPKSGECLRVFTGHAGGINALAIDSDSGILYSASDDKTIRAWDTSENGGQIAQYVGHEGIVSALALHGGHVFSGSYDKTIIQWKKVWAS